MFQGGIKLKGSRKETKTEGQPEAQALIQSNPTEVCTCSFFLFEWQRY